SFGQALTVTRTYNSRNITATADGPFGPGWTTSLAVDDSVSAYSALDDSTLSVDGIAELIADDGTVVNFERQPDGTFSAEADSKDLTLTATSTCPIQSGTTATYVLTDVDGNTTCFNKVSGASQSTPFAASQPGSSTKTSFT